MKIVNKSNNPLPRYSHEGDSGMDLRANLDEDLILLPGKRALIPTGIHLELPKFHEGQVRGRSGLALRHGIGVVQGIGTIDENFVGEIGVILINHGTKPFTIENGDRIAQLVISKVVKFELEEVDSIDNLRKTNRGEKGYGSSGIK